MEKEDTFFMVAAISENFLERILDPKTRLETVKEGFAGIDFGVEEIDEEIFEEIGKVASVAEFLLKFQEIKNQKK
jgi:hypothetical protein